MRVSSASFSLALSLAALYFVIGILLASALSTPNWAYNVAHCPDISTVVQVLMGVVSYDLLQTSAITGATTTDNNKIYSGNTALESKAESNGFVCLALGIVSFVNCLCTLIFCIGLSRGSVLSGKLALFSSSMSSIFLSVQCGATPLLKGSANDVVAFVKYYVDPSLVSPSSVTSELGSGFAMSFCCVCLSYIGTTLLGYEIIGLLHYLNKPLRYRPAKG